MHRWDDFASYEDFDEPMDDDFDDFDDDEDDMPRAKGGDFDDDNDDFVDTAGYMDVAAVVEDAEYDLEDYVLADVAQDDDSEPRAKGGKGVSSEWDDFDDEDDFDERHMPRAKEHASYRLARVHGGY